MASIQFLTFFLILLPLLLAHTVPLRHFPLDQRIASPSTRARTYIKSSGSSESVTLHDNWASYYTALYFGTPETEAQVIIDTGSSLTAIPSTGLEKSCVDQEYNQKDSTSSDVVSCSSKLCGHHKASNGCMSDSSCGFSTSYADGSNLKGILVTDKLSLGDLNMSMPIGVITNHSGNFKSSSMKCLGILGLAYNNDLLTCQPNCLKPVFDYFVDDKLAKDIFGIYLEPSIFDGGYLTLGVLETKFYDNLTYTPVTKEAFYSVKMNSLDIDNTSITSSGFSDAFVDSGTTFLLLPSKAFSSLTKFLTTSSEYSGLPGIKDDTFFASSLLGVSISKSQLQDYPNMTVVMNGASISIYPEHYLVETSEGSGSYIFGIRDSGSSTMTILGDTFMRAAGYTVFDRKNKRVGFSQASYSTYKDPYKELKDMIKKGLIPGLCFGVVVLVIGGVLFLRRRSRGHHHYEPIPH